jgi:NAD(P)-dependent dehydrogenase (short-subunit alcohol dehydrogenase family)
MAGRLEGKICLITGAAGRESDDTQQIHFEDWLTHSLSLGIGRALVDGYVEAGATVIAADLVKLEHEGVDAVVCDQGDVESIAKLEEYIKAKWATRHSRSSIAAFRRSSRSDDHTQVRSGGLPRQQRRTWWEPL